MRNLLHNDVERYRDRSDRILAVYGDVGDWTCGAFNVPSKIDGANMFIIASSDDGWDHVSVSRKNRCPNWLEMCQVKDMFFEPNEWVVQYHPAVEAYVNFHPNCLHLWRPKHQTMPMPPTWMGGPKTS